MYVENFKFGWREKANKTWDYNNALLRAKHVILKKKESMNIFTIITCL